MKCIGFKNKRRDLKLVEEWAIKHYNLDLLIREYDQLTHDQKKIVGLSKKHLVRLKKQILT